MRRPRLTKPSFCIHQVKTVRVKQAKPVHAARDQDSGHLRWDSDQKRSQGDVWSAVIPCSLIRLLVTQVCSQFTNHLCLLFCMYSRPPVYADAEPVDVED